MFSDTSLDPTLVQAYLETEYCVQGDRPFTMHISTVSDVLLAEYKHRRVNSSAFLTAWNPYSRLTEDIENQQRQHELARELTKRGLTFLPSVGLHPSGKWRGEESFLVFGLNLQAAKALGQKMEQNAIIWSGSDGVPQLILLR